MTSGYEVFVLFILFFVLVNFGSYIPISFLFFFFLFLFHVFWGFMS
jgi:hypothetical protein